MEQAAKKKLNGRFLAILGAIIVLGGSYGFYLYRHGQHHEITDDAQIDAHVSPVIPKVSGYIKEIRIQDNQQVKKGDTLLVIDDAEFVIRLQQAEAAARIARSQLKVAAASAHTTGTALDVSKANALSVQANVATADANIEAAKVKLWRAKNDFDRYKALFDERSITRQQFEEAQASKETAEKQLQVLQEQKAAIQKQTQAANTQIGSTKSQIEVAKSQIEVADASISQAETNIENARLQLSYTVIIAQTDGQVSKVNLQEGQLIQAGQALFMLVDIKNQWVVANFKETQMDKIRIGQAVHIKIDAFPEAGLKGTVESIAPATGSKFALLPPDNASGNFVKTIQRVPVRIALSAESGELLSLIRPGMNVEVDVNI